MLPSAPPSPRASAWEWAQAGLVAVSLIWTTLGFGGAWPATMVVTCALNALALAVHLIARARSPAPPPLHPAGWLLLPFLTYGIVNVVAITPVPWIGWDDWLKWAQLVAVFWVVLNGVRLRGPRRLLLGALVAIATVAVALACYQRFARPDWLMLGRLQREQYLARSSGPFFWPNSLAALLILVLPVTLVPLWRRGAGAVARVGFGYVAALLVLGLGLTVSRGAWIGGAVALAVWPLCASRLGWWRRLAVFAAVAGGVAVAVAVVQTAMPVARERLGYLLRDAGERSRPVMWRAAWEIFKEHPVAGGGAGSYAVRFEKYRPEHDQADPVWVHNDYLNTLCDYGAVGFTLFFGACAVIVGGCLRRRPEREVGAMTREWPESRAFTTALAMGLLAFALHLGVDFHFKVPALALLAATVAGLAVARAWPVDGYPAGAKPAPRGGGTKGVGWYAAAAAVLLAAAAWGVPHYRAEAERRDAREPLDRFSRSSISPAERRAQTIAAREGFSRALALDPGNAQAWADRAYAAAILARDEPAREAELGRAAEADARQALARARLVPEYWLRLGVALDMQDRWTEAGAAFTEALQLAPTNATPWFYCAYHLSLNPQTHKLAMSAVAISLRLDPTRPEGDALRQHLAERR